MTVTHTKPSTGQPPANFEYLCQPCENPPAAQQEASDDSDDEKEDDESKVPPVERNITPKDVMEISDDDDYIYIVGTQGKKVTRLHNLENMTKLKVNYTTILSTTTTTPLISFILCYLTSYSVFYMYYLFDNNK